MLGLPNLGSIDAITFEKRSITSILAFLLLS
ncbi:MAG: hypothetical protein ACI9ZV_001005 [Candidatus Azotimanducaceae bacterium]|jgi:hypothetical protein